MSNAGPALRAGPRVNWRWTGLIVLAILSEAAGLMTAHWFFRIYEQTVPPALVTSFNSAAAYGWFLTNGAILGAVFFAWGVVAAWAGRFFRKPAPPP